MPKYFCKNCYNFKTRLINRNHLSGISNYKILKAIKEQNILSLGFAFPFNMTVYKRIRRHGECGIFYCAKELLKRELCIDRGDAANISCGVAPCSEYKPVYEKSNR